jgi:hypothetical protein
MKSVRLLFCMLLSAVFAIGCATAQSAPQGPEVLTFADCLTVPHKLLKTYPAQCITADGKVFVDPRGKASDKLCQNRCGDGNCDEVVCMGSHCPCAETADSCPADCKK